MKFSESYMMGRLQGVIKGISMRNDVSPELKKLCEEVLKDYDEWRASDEKY